MHVNIIPHAGETHRGVTHDVHDLKRPSKYVVARKYVDDNIKNIEI